MLRLADHWIWDFWLVVDGDDAHVFYLHAPRSLGDPDRRHHHARIGHAVSHDLVQWDVLPAVRGLGSDRAFDDLATWTGSVIRHDDAWLMAYTGVTKRESGLIQRIGFAGSSDLAEWERRGPVIEADPRWYEIGPTFDDVHWRDPWIHQAPDGTVHLLITARRRAGPVDSRGAIGHAWSRDIETWSVGAPLSDPAPFRQLEVPQLVVTPERSFVLFSAMPADHAARIDGDREGGMHQLAGPTPLGPFTVAPGPFLVGDASGSRYAGRLVEFRGAWHLLTWTQWRHGAFVGELADPLPVEVDPRHGMRVIANSAAVAP